MKSHRAPLPQPRTNKHPPPSPNRSQLRTQPTTTTLSTAHRLLPTPKLPSLAKSRPIVPFACAPWKPAKRLRGAVWPPPMADASTPFITTVSSRGYPKRKNPNAPSVDNPFVPRPHPPPNFYNSTRPWWIPITPTATTVTTIHPCHPFRDPLPNKWHNIPWNKIDDDDEDKVLPQWNNHKEDPPFPLRSSIANWNWRCGYPKPKPTRELDKNNNNNNHQANRKIHQRRVVMQQRIKTTSQRQHLPPTAVIGMCNQISIVIICKSVIVLSASIIASLPKASSIQ